MLLLKDSRSCRDTIYVICVICLFRILAFHSSCTVYWVYTQQIVLSEGTIGLFVLAMADAHLYF